ncbi:Protein UNC-86 b [Aphelenchoides avenae]|nr:Protein UNC-86 b [Aphelenchus avenae]
MREPKSAAATGDVRNAGASPLPQPLPVAPPSSSATALPLQQQQHISTAKTAKDEVGVQQRDGGQEGEIRVPSSHSPISASRITDVNTPDQASGTGSSVCSAASTYSAALNFPAAVQQFDSTGFLASTAAYGTTQPSLYLFYPPAGGAEALERVAMMQAPATPAAAAAAQRLYPSLAIAATGNGGNSQQPGGPNGSANGGGRYSPTGSSNYNRRMPSSNSIFGSFDVQDPFFQHARVAQAAALAEMDVKNVNVSAASMLRPTADMFSAYNHHGLAASSSIDFDQMIVPSSSMSDISLMQQATADGGMNMASLQQMMAMQHHYPPQFAQYPTMAPAFAAQTGGMPHLSAPIVVSSMQNSVISRYPLSTPGIEAETDPRELERFAEHFKQRRIKLGVTQADVGKALAHLKMPGVGSLSQSTICRFESLTLSHNNMVALKPILHSWLEKAEDATKNKDINGDAHGILPNSEKKRKRTSIAAPEKRLLEEYFRTQPRPTGDKISQIAEKLELKKNVVRVWFCNQRQKQKRQEPISMSQPGQR